ncbi:MAG: DoxX family protein [Proteobacteria bacterium]|nr:DoxX family protein [Pseudomonadota bacterium]MBI3496275.1 DoxX family protein [Pseudomonadota bacterium]
MLSVMRIAVALLYLEAGTAKFLGFPHVANFDTLSTFSLIWFAGVIELVGGTLLVLGLLTRPVAFLCSGEMAFAYFISHAPRSFFPLLNGGIAAAAYSFVFLYIAVVGGGAWSLDRVLERRRSE